MGGRGRGELGTPPPSWPPPAAAIWGRGAPLPQPRRLTRCCPQYCQRVTGACGGEGGGVWGRHEPTVVQLVVPMKQPPGAPSPPPPICQSMGEPEAPRHEGGDGQGGTTT